MEVIFEDLELNLSCKNLASLPYFSQMVITALMGLGIRILFP